MQKFEEKYLPGDLLAAVRLLEAYQVFCQRDLWDLARATKNELERLEAYKREDDQLNHLKENLKSRGFTEIVVKIEEFHIHAF